MPSKQTNTDSREARIPKDNDNDAGRFFATATILARKGRYDEAAKLLQKAVDAAECSKAEGFDLLARIYVQQGRHLDAESCWREAKHLDESNPAYDDALNRLRRGRLSSSRFVPVAGAFSAIAFLALLLWQVLFVNPNVHSRQDAAEASLTAIREDIATSQNASQERGLELATGIAGLGRSLIERDSQLAQQLKALSTSAETAKDRDAVIARLDEQVAALQKVLESQVGSLGARYEELNSTQIKQIETIRASVDDMEKALAAVEGRLGERIKKVEGVETAIRSDVKSLPTSADLAALQKVLGCEVDDLGARYEKLNIAQTKEIKASVVDIGNALAAVEGRLVERIKKVEGVETAIRSDILSTAADLTAIGRSILMLDRQLFEIQATIKQMKDTAGQEPVEADGEESGGQPKLQSEGHP